VYDTLREAGVRVALDTSADKSGAKIRNAQLEKTPYMLVVGQKEAEASQVAVRHHKRGDLGVKGLEEFLAQVQEEIKTRAL
jgi:threonyl-tRNA synthetase